MLGLITEDPYIAYKYSFIFASGLATTKISGFYWIPKKELLKSVYYLQLMK